MLKKIYDQLFKKSSSPKANSQPKPQPDVLAAFFNELYLYRPALIRALTGLIGEQACLQAFERLTAMDARGSYITHPDDLAKTDVFFPEPGQDLGFYVLCRYLQNSDANLKDSGEIQDADRLQIAARPFFLYWPQAIDRWNRKMQKYSLPGYFTPWLHEFGHFLCYHQQPLPIMMAINILTAEFARRGFQINQLSDLDAIDQHKQNTPIVKMARLYVQICAVNEAMATWWEAHLLKAMEFDATEYLYQKKANNPYINQLNKVSSSNTLKYIRNWHQKNYYQDSFSIHFLTSANHISTDKWGFLKKADD